MYCNYLIWNEVYGCFGRGLHAEILSLNIVATQYPGDVKFDVKIQNVYIIELYLLYYLDFSDCFHPNRDNAKWQSESVSSSIQSQQVKKI